MESFTAWFFWTLIPNQLFLVDLFKQQDYPGVYRTGHRMVDLQREVSGGQGKAFFLPLLPGLCQVAMERVPRGAQNRIWMVRRHGKVSASTGRPCLHRV